MATAKKSSTHTLPAKKRNSLSEGAFAFPKERKEPLNDASHVHNAIARFDQVKDVSPTERSAAFKRIKAAAKKFGVDMPETSPSDLGSEPHTPNKATKKTAKKATKKSSSKG